MKRINPLRRASQRDLILLLWVILFIVSIGFFVRGYLSVLGFSARGFWTFSASIRLVVTIFLDFLSSVVIARFYISVMLAPLYVGLSPRSRWAPLSRLGSGRCRRLRKAIGALAIDLGPTSWLLPLMLSPFLSQSIPPTSIVWLGFVGAMYLVVMALAPKNPVHELKKGRLQSNLIKAIKVLRSILAKVRACLVFCG